MKRILLFFVSLLFVISGVHAQEDERLQPKGLLFERPIDATPSVYTHAKILLSADAPALAAWKKQNWKAVQDGLGTGRYTNSSVSLLESPSIALPSLADRNGRLNLYVKQWFEIESYHDKGSIQVSDNNGATWTTLSIVDGKSDWHTAVVNLTDYAGKNVKLAFRLEADKSNNYEGWKVASFVLKQETLISKAAPAKSGVNARSFGIQAALDASIQGAVDAQRFPRYIFTHVNVYDGATPLLTLGREDFHVREYLLSDAGGIDTVAVSREGDDFVVYTPQADTIRKPVDIIFLMDNSGSMQDKQDSVSANVATFVRALDDADFDYRLGLCRFGQADANGVPLFQENARLWSNANDFLTMWDAANNTSGSREPSWDALYQSAQQYSFQPGAQRIFILITDESITGNNISNQIITDRQVIIDKLVDSGIKTYTLVPTSSVFQADFGTIATATGGRSYDIFSTFNDILNDIGEDIRGTYTIRHVPTNPFFDGRVRTVEVTVARNSERKKVFGQYTPGAAPIILRTDHTMALHRTPQVDGIPVKIEVQAIDWDAFLTNAVTLYYRKAGTNDVYKTLTMTQRSVNSGTPTTSVWDATIIAGDVVGPGIQYYIRATDGQSTTIAPEFTDRPGFPFSFAVLPNVAPTIQHDKIESKDPKAKIPVVATVIDNTLSVSKVYLYWKKEVDNGYTMQEMTLSQTVPNQYEYEIPALNVNTIVSYFIVAIDNYNVSAFSGTETSPHTIAVGLPWGVPNYPSFHTIRFFSSGIYTANVKLEGQNLEAGDIIAAFYKDAQNVLRPGGSAVWPATSVVAYADNTSTLEKDGFSAGEEFVFKIFKKSTGEVFNTEVRLYTAAPSLPNFQLPNKQSFVQSLQGYWEQDLELTQGLNMWSTYMFPKDNALSDILGPISSSVDFVNDAEGREYRPGGSNTLTAYTPGYGYGILMRNAATLKVKGSRIRFNPTNLQVTLKASGTYVACPYQRPENVEAVFPMGDPNVYVIDRYVVDNAGNLVVQTYSPAWGMNDWVYKNLEPGEAYNVLVFQDQPFTFPAPLGPYAARAAAGKAAAHVSRSPQVITSTDNYMHLLIPADAWRNAPSAQDEVRIYNKTGKLVAHALVSENGTIITLDGTKVRDRENFYLRRWNQASLTEEPLYVSEWKTGSNKYKNLSVSVISKFESEDVLKGHKALDVFPNPIVSEGTVRFSLPVSDDIAVELYDIQGGKVERTLVQKNYVKGSHEVNLDKQGLKPGIYVVKFITGSTFETRRVIIK